MASMEAYSLWMALALKPPVRGVIFGSCAFWGLILSSMIDLLAPGVSLLSDTSGVVDFPSVPPGGDYYIECKYPTITSSAVIHLMLLDAVNTSVGIFESGRFNLRR